MVCPITYGDHNKHVNICTDTVDMSAKAHLTSVLVRPGLPPTFNDVFICQPSLKISCKTIKKFFSAQSC